MGGKMAKFCWENYSYQLCALLSTFVPMFNTSRTQIHIRSDGLKNQNFLVGRWQKRDQKISFDQMVYNPIAQI
jgi:hypothetical protein